jgi:transposase
MKRIMRYVGMDVHAETIAVAVVDADGAERDLGVIANRPEAIRKCLKRIGPPEELHCCYEAGPTGYVLYWQLMQMGIECTVAAPTLIPTKAGDRVKTDRRDARKLARYLRSGDLTAVWVPDEVHEALRDLVRARQAAKIDEKRARHRLQKFLLRHGQRPPPGTKAWTGRHRAWLAALQFERPALQVVLGEYLHEVLHSEQRVERLDTAIAQAVELAPAAIRAVVEALQGLRGVRTVTAVGVVAELGQFSRFAHPRQLMGYSGAVPSEFSTGGPGKHQRGAITKAGNAHLRRLLGEAAWCYRYRPAVRYPLKKRQQNLAPKVIDISWKAQVRLCHRYRRMVTRGKVKQKVVIAVARELLAFMWAIGVEVEKHHGPPRVAAA